MWSNHPNEAEAREEARKRGPVHVQITQSMGEYYVESDDDIGMVRAHERLVYSGLGSKA